MIEANRRTALWVGGLVIAAGLIGGAILILVGVRAPLLHRHERLQVRLPDVSGLRVGARVVVAGVPVGSVATIRLAPPDVGGAVAAIEVEPSTVRRLRSDATATLRTIGLLGDRVVALEPGSAAAPLAPGQVLESSTPTGAGGFDQAGELARKLGRLADRAEESLDRAQPALVDLAAASGSLRRWADRADRGPGLLHALAYDAALTDGLRASIVDARTSAARMAEASRSADEGLRQLHASATALAQIVAHVRSGQGTLGGFVYDPAIYESVRTFVGQVTRSRILRALLRLTIEHGTAPPPGR